MQRRLAAIVCADVAGYSRMMGADEAGTHAAFKAHRSAIYHAILNHGGRMVALELSTGTRVWGVILTGQQLCLIRPYYSPIPRVAIQRLL